VLEYSTIVKREHERGAPVLLIYPSDVYKWTRLEESRDTLIPWRPQIRLSRWKYHTMILALAQYIPALRGNAHLSSHVVERFGGGLCGGDAFSNGHK
jgi:hypothetical protein